MAHSVIECTWLAKGLLTLVLGPPGRSDGPMDQIGRKNATAKVEMCITDRFEHTAVTARARGRHHCTDFHRVLFPRPFFHARRVG